MNAILVLLLAGLASADDPADLYREGMRLLAANQPAAAASVFERAVRLNAKDAPAWKGLGVARASQGDYAAAEEPFHRACLLDRDLADACLYFGRTLYLEDRYEPALDVLRRAVERDPENAQLHRIAALCLEALGRTAEAEAAFRQALRFRHTAGPDEDAAIDFGVFLYRQGRAAEALPPLEDAVKRHPQAARAHLELGCVLLALDRLPDAAAHLERSVTLNGRAARAHLLLGRTYLRMGKPELAQPHLDQGARTVK